MLLGIDYGDKRIGISVSSGCGTLAAPLKTYIAKSMRKSIDHISTLIKANDIKKVVVGLPLNMDGTEGFRAKKVIAFGTVLQRVSGKEVVYQDERLTSIQAEEILKNLKYGNNKEKVDLVSAVLILQSYIDTQSTP